MRINFPSLCALFYFGCIQAMHIDVFNITISQILPLGNKPPQFKIFMK